MQIAPISVVGINVTATKAMKATALTVQVHFENNYILNPIYTTRNFRFGTDEIGTN